MSGIIVHEWLAPEGGSENVFEAIAETFPDAERWCLWNDAGARFEPVNETVLARTPLRRSKAAALPFMPGVWRRLPEREADWILVSSHLFAHHARFRGGARDAPKIVYAHTPARYIWAPELDGRGSGGAARLASALLKPLDRRRAQEPAVIAANSQFVARRVAETWQRDAEVIYPPVSIDRFMAEPALAGEDAAVAEALPNEFILGFSRFVPYKKLESAIDVGRACGLPVVLAGSGPEEARLRELASRAYPGGVQFVVRPSGALLVHLMRRASALVFAPVEDFGIVPVEAMAAGTPVIANAIGGAAESVVDGVTGAIVHEWDSKAGLRRAAETALSTSSSACVARAQSFAEGVFRSKVADLVVRATQ